MRRQLAALFLFCIIDTLGFGILIPLVPYMADRFGTAPQFITPVLGSYSLCQLLAAPWWGRLSDRYGRRPVLMSSLAGACLSYVILGCARNIWWLLASRMLAGAMAGNIAAAFAYASDVSPPEKRAAALGLIGAAIGIGFTLGTAARWTAGRRAIRTRQISALPRRCPQPERAGDPAGEVRAAREPYRGASRLQPHQPRRGAWRLLRARPALAYLAAATLVVTYSQAILESIFAIWALHRYGFGPRTVGFLLFGIALPALLMQGVIVRALAPRLGEARLARGGVLLYVAGLLVLAAAGTSALRPSAACCYAASGSAPITRAPPHSHRSSRAFTTAAQCWAPTWRARVSRACSGPSHPVRSTRCSVRLRRSSSVPASRWPRLWLLRRAAAAAPA